MDKIRNSILKYPGGKARELNKFEYLFPSRIDTLVDPFVGGGSVWIGSSAKKYIINDFSKDLINLYNSIKYNEKLLDLYLNKLDTDLNSIKFDENIIKKIKNSKNLNEIIEVVKEFANKIKFNFDGIKQEFKNEYPKYVGRKENYIKKNDIIISEDLIKIMQTSLYASYYNSVRKLYNEASFENNQMRASAYLYIREFCYSSMFRFSKSGKFNVPYGGETYNKKDFCSHETFYNSDFLKDKIIKTKIYNYDFEKFINKLSFSENDFIFLDPPYDTEFSTYDNNKFDKNEQIRLANLLSNLHVKWMIVIKDSELIRSLYPIDKFRYVDYKNNYSVNFKNRNNKKVNHLVIMNY
ncbi:DNA adenine methylase [Fructilactobacillus frigidiflavus]|uniref:DNA adenine methylase n=1 Tax=Fructilactobacillus frigidiflavus TaxID=3242688 RepID=UPI00375788ED